MTSICEKNLLKNIFVEFHHFTEAAIGDVLQKGVLNCFPKLQNKTILMQKTHFDCVSN